jgi:hypothetical protein
MLRGGYSYETDISDKDLKRTANDGPAAGATIEVPLGKSDKKFGIDYSYTFTTPYDGTHRMGIKLTL